MGVFLYLSAKNVQCHPAKDSVQIKEQDCAVPESFPDFAMTLSTKMVEILMGLFSVNIACFDKNKIK